jgi:hypothetical protein
MGRYINSGNTLLINSAKKIFFPASTTSTPQTWTVPTGVTCATFEVWGGGGAGSPSCCCTCYFGEPGGGGGYSMKTVPVTPGTTYSIVVGQGGCGNMCWFNGNACGCCGFPSYVTGQGLTNFCANGGQGGAWCNSATSYSCGGCAYGGDVSITGMDGSTTSQCSFYRCGTQAGGASPFGGGWTMLPRHVGSVSSSLNCGVSGAYPGGGSPARTGFQPGWCDCCQGCTSGAADGLVVITI